MATRQRLSHRTIAFASALIGMAVAVQPPSAQAEGSRLWATGGIANVNGSAGGGITSWAVLNGYASEDEITANVSGSHVTVDNFELDTAAIGLTWNNRVAVTAARNKLTVEPLQTDIEQDTFGLKVRIVGEALYDRFGQYSAGVQYTRNRDFEIPSALGARDDSGLDFYLAASKMFLAGIGNRNILVNATVRATQANQLGLLGFGGESGYSVVGEFSAGIFLTRRWLLGAEYRQKPDNLGAVTEDDWKSLYVVYVPSRHLALALARVDLGSIAGFDDQSGYFLSLQTGF